MQKVGSFSSGFSNLQQATFVLVALLLVFLAILISHLDHNIRETVNFQTSSEQMSYPKSVFQSSNQVQAEDAPVSGGGLSQNGKFSYGYASSPGKRASMEDFYETRIDGVEGEIVGLFGVFDGHGGARAAEYVKQNLFRNLISHPNFISDTKSAIADAYNHTDSEFLKSENTTNRDAGSTASTAILVGDRLLVANVGDSRAVICRGGNAIAVSRDHKPDQSDERQRIEDAGGFVMWAGTWRVGGVLAVSRAFGDRMLKQYVVADPEIQEEKIDTSLEFLILASDGLWDVVTNEEAVAMTKSVTDPEVAAKRLMQEASQRGSADNITIVVVRFNTTSNTNTTQLDGASSNTQTTNQGASSNRQANQGQLGGGSSNQAQNNQGQTKSLGASSNISQTADQGADSSNRQANQGQNNQGQTKSQPQPVGGSFSLQANQATGVSSNSKTSQSQDTSSTSSKSNQSVQANQGQGQGGPTANTQTFPGTNKRE